MDQLENEFKYYIEHQNELVNAHYGRFVIIKDFKVLGDFGSEVEAILFAKSRLHLAMGTFIVQHCLPGEENYTNYISAPIKSVRV